MLSRVPLASISTSVLVLALASACAKPSAHDAPRQPRAGVLSTLGFALENDGDPATPAGDLTATFDAPVVDLVTNSAATLDAYGTAHVAFDDGARDLASAAVLGAVSDTDVAYAVLFDADAPWRYVVVAAHAADLSSGAALALDNDQAAAIVVDELDGSAYVTTDGTLTITSASLEQGGRLVASVSGGLAEVTLESWPQNLFPFSDDDMEGETVTATGDGSFSAVWSERGDGGGSANFVLNVDGLTPFAADGAYAMPLESGSTAIVLTTASDPNRILVVAANNSALLADATIAFDGFASGAWLLEADGSQVAFTTGSLIITSATVEEGGTIEGSLHIDGVGYAMGADEFPGEGEGEGEGEWQQDCTGLDTLASDFVPAFAYIDGNYADDDLPPGFDRVLYFMNDAEDAAFGLLLAVDVDLSASQPYLFSTLDLEGTPYPTAMMALVTCDDSIVVDSGSLSVSSIGEQLTGVLDATVSGAAHNWTFDVPLITL
jgi:hypothetical protein